MATISYRLQPFSETIYIFLYNFFQTNSTIWTHPMNRRSSGSKGGLKKMKYKPIPARINPTDESINAERRRFR